MSAKDEKKTTAASVPIGDPRDAGSEGKAGDQREAGKAGPAGDPRKAGEPDSKAAEKRSTES